MLRGRRNDKLKKIHRNHNMASRVIRNAAWQHLHSASAVFSSASIIFVVVYFLLVGGAAADQSHVKSRLLNRDEGLVVVEAISEHRTRLHARGPRPDCSHLVNDVYNLAGFPYAYTKSSDLYGGSSAFERVKLPQPGDLIVWRGHVGLVTDPRGHRFYSALRSGLDTEDYTSAYWTKHGTARFFRYRVTHADAYLLTRTKVREGDQQTERSYRTLQAFNNEAEEKSRIPMAPDSHSAGPKRPTEILLTAGSVKPPSKK